MQMITSKITKIEVATFSLKATDKVGSFVEMAELVANSSRPEVTIHFENGMQIRFHDTEFSNGSKEVTITLPTHLEE